MEPKNSFQQASIQRLQKRVSHLKEDQLEKYQHIEERITQLIAVLLTELDQFLENIETPNLVHFNKKKIFDQTHQYMYFNDFLCSVIDTVQFQRLRDLKQLGFNYLYFPCGIHSRFEHSLGTGHLADKFMHRALKKGGGADLTWREQDYLHESVVLAGLCHDLGHGPFSHFFDRTVIPGLYPSLDWTHEMASEMMFEYMIDDNSIDIDSSQKKLVQSLIMGDILPEYKEVEWIYEIISNPKTGIDVDRWDYMKRDPTMVGLQDLVFNADPLMENFRIIDNRVCYNQNMAHKVYDFYNNRYRLFKGLYHSHQVSSFEQMMKECFELTKEEFKWDEIVFDKERYLYTTDNVFYQFERHENPKVREIIKRIKQRDNYKSAGVLEWPTNSSKRHSEDQLRQMKQDIINTQSIDGGPQLINDDLILLSSQINYGTQKYFDNTMLYDSSKLSSRIQADEPSEAVKNLHSFSNLIMPQAAFEYSLNLFVKDKAKLAQSQKAWNKYLEKNKASMMKLE